MHHTLYSYDVIKHLVVLKSNTTFIPDFQLGERPITVTDDASLNRLFTVHFYVVDEPDSFIPGLTHISHSFYLVEGVKGVYGCFELFKYAKPYRVKLECLILNVDRNPTLMVNTPYYMYSHRLPLTIETLLPIGHILTDIIQSKLLQQGYTLLHCSAITLNDRAIIFLAPPDTGKTLMSILGVLHLGFKLISEDMAVVDKDGSIYSVPNTTTFIRNRWLMRRLRDRGFFTTGDYYKALITSWFGGKLPLLPLKPIPPRIHHKIPFKDKARIEAIVLLSKRQGDVVEEIDFDKVFNLAILYNKLEFTYYKNPFIQIYSLINPSYSTSRLTILESQVINRALSKAKRILHVKMSRPSTDLLRQIVREVL